MTGAAPPRRLRADALRNRERLLEAAKSVFSAGGPEASLEGVARKAGVGIGTLYRHFPTREALFEAVYRREVEQLACFAERLGAAADPLDAFRHWLRAAVELVATKKGMLGALALALDGASELYAYSSESLTRAVRLLLDRAVAAGAVRVDVSADDILRAVIGMCSVNERAGWQESVFRLLDLMIEGMKVKADER